MNKGHGLWLDKLSNVALDLIIRVVPLTLQGGKRKNNDMHRHSFIAIGLSDGFKEKIKAQCSTPDSCSPKGWNAAS